MNYTLARDTDRVRSLSAPSTASITAPQYTLISEPSPANPFLGTPTILMPSVTKCAPTPTGAIGSPSTIAVSEFVSGLQSSAPTQLEHKPESTVTWSQSNNSRQGTHHHLIQRCRHRCCCHRSSHHRRHCCGRCRSCGRCHYCGCCHDCDHGH